MLIAILAVVGVVLLGLAAFPQAHGPRWQPGWLGLAFVAAAVLTLLDAFVRLVH